MADDRANLNQLIDTYCAGWSDPDPARRREILGAVWADGGTYVDPTVHAVGLDELLAHIEVVVASRPGAKVVRTSKVDTHHGLARFAWHVRLADGTTLPEGLDVVELSAGGQIRCIVGFFGPLKADSSTV
jgi:hypothetical protein